MDGPNIAAMSISMSAIVILYLGKEKGNFMKFIDNNFLILFLAIALLATGSRGGLITFGVVIIVYYVYLRKSVVRQLVITVVFFLLSISMFNIFANEKSILKVNNFLTDNGVIRRIDNVGGGDIRFVLWESGWNAIKGSYFLGVGLSQYRSNYKVFEEYTKDVDSRWVIGRDSGLGLHNLFVETAVDAGVISLIILIVIFMNIFKTVNRREKSILKVMQMLLFINLLLSAMAGRLILSSIFWICLIFILHVKPLELENKSNER